MPFSEQTDPVWEGVLAPTLTDLGYEPRRADSVADQQNVLRDIVAGVASADLIIADLTGLNPNVFYELGIAHGLGIPTLLITQDLEQLPFDLRAYRVTAYSTDFDKIGLLEATLREVAEKHLAGQVRFGSPVSDFLGVPIKGTEASSSEPGDAPALLAAASAAGDAVLDALSTFGEAIDDLVQALDHVAPGFTQPKVPDAVAADAAARFLATAVHFEQAAVRVREAVRGQQETTLQYLATVAAAGDGSKAEIDKEGMRKLLAITGALVPRMVNAFAIPERFRGRTPALDRALDRLARATDASISALEDEQAFAARTLAILDRESE